MQPRPALVRCICVCMHVVSCMRTDVLCLFCVLYSIRNIICHMCSMKSRDWRRVMGMATGVFPGMSARARPHVGLSVVSSLERERTETAAKERERETEH